jgi:uncharacterized protein YbbC (DUF1343 family)
MTVFFKKSIPFVGLLFIITSCSVNKNILSKNTTSHPTTTATQKHLSPSQPINFKTGADNFENYLPILKDKKVGVVSNQTGILTNKTHLVDFLVANAIDVQKIFAPEHGFRGTADAGELIVDGKDTKTGLPIISLYGDNKKPKPEQLQGIEILVFDIQDVGARFYTYISTLHYVMEACAENNIQLLVLDRPNPNGFIIDGPILEKEFSSFVGMHPVPILYGMTIGEYAQMINGEKWLHSITDSGQAPKCDLKVIPCVQYDRNASYAILEKPSPNLPNDKAINLYASLCLFEGTNVSSGRGTEKQFQIYGSPFLPQGGFSFTPEPNLGAKEPMHKGAICNGEDLSTIEPVSQIELKWLLKAYNTTEDKTKFFNPFFFKLAGTNALQLQIEAGLSERKIKKSWKAGQDQFKEIRKKYLLY